MLASRGEGGNVPKRKAEGRLLSQIETMAFQLCHKSGAGDRGSCNFVRANIFEWIKPFAWRWTCSEISTGKPPSLRSPDLAAAVSPPG